MTTEKKADENRELKGVREPMKLPAEPEKPACMSTEPITSGEPEELFRNLVASIRRYHPSDNLRAILQAYEIAREAHKDQKRRSGEPYIIHPLCVAIVLAELELDKESIVAAILHDVVEDTVMTLEEIEKKFGAEVALLVDGVTKLTQISWQADKVEIQAENLRHMFLAMAKDIRVILIKLADRLHNMRTLEYMTTAKQTEKARETLEIYAPIADRLGISRIKTELDDLSLKYLESDVYYDLFNRLTSTEEERERFISNVIGEVQKGLTSAGIEGQINGRVKHIFSIYKKMKTQDKTLDQIYDVFAIRILVGSVKDCYAALGVMHEMYKPVPGRFKDYIAMPKPNMYQSLHTTLISNLGIPFEIQIRTYEMHRTAEYGIAAHWKYKESGSGQKLEESEANKMKWLKEVLEWQKDMSDNREFLSSVKNDFDMFSENVYCFTPSGDVKTLPNGSTPVDFAYSIHSAVGNKMVGARVNNKLVPIDYVIQNGDRIEIITSQNSRGPSRDWLKCVRSSQARNKINQWFKTEFKEENILKGKELVDRCCKTKNVAFSEINKPEYMEVILRKYGFKDWESVLAAIGHGGLKEGQVVNRLLEEHERRKRAETTDTDVLNELAEKTGRALVHRNKGGILVKGVHDLAVHFSKCCNPVPGDEIVGFVTRGRGISIHRTDCINMMNLPELERARLIDAEWQTPEGETGSQKYMAEIKIFASNRTGIMVDITRIFTERGIDIQTMTARTNKQGRATFSLMFEVGGKEELKSLVEKLRQVESVLDIVRATGG
ncbi:MAG: bifunctional (p)ppGpp synthetase/guanosine-3',5'-bis(diphosphate) 3'-pyrophosphohydrolase [Lachnospiraceae bacterium]|nr:bifunctional (p)ppGpp synthetase/guanosine-3',5'-bis(diphosphate) 3'-pyrophosphohydrolase [Lachnospiraceae bacterium]